jgi:hypothetical protein
VTVRDGDGWWQGGVISQIWPRSIWLNPVDASPRQDWGDDVSDFRAVDPQRGSAWSADDATGQSYLHTFLSSQPDLDWGPTHTFSTRERGRHASTA